MDAETLNMERIFRASRYGKGGEDYLNCPFTEDEYRVFYEALITAETVQAHEFEDVKFFEACLPIEELARRGYDTLRFGPMKPVGLIDPRTGRQPFAVVQLRPENLRFSSYNLVGFQNHLRFPEQKRILRLIPGLENAEFLRLGQIHRNTYINSPRLLNPDLSFRSAPQVFVAGQLSGVEGYVECIATGLLAGLAMAARLPGSQLLRDRHRARRRWGRWCTTSLTRSRATTSPRTFPLICCHRWKVCRALWLATAAPGARSSASERWRILKGGLREWRVRCRWGSG